MLPRVSAHIGWKTGFGPTAMVRSMNTRTLPFEIKSVADSGMVEGVISAFGGVDAYGDKIERGAYAKSLKRLAESGRKLPVLYQHDPARPIGVWSDLHETDAGLVGKADLALEVPDAGMAHALARKGALTGISIGYEVAPGGARNDGNVRVLSDIILWEASLVTFPADPKARVTGVKSGNLIEAVEQLVREFDYSGRQAKTAASALWRALTKQPDDDAEAEAELKAILDASAKRIASIGASKTRAGDGPVNTFDWS